MVTFMKVLPLTNCSQIGKDIFPAGTTSIVLCLAKDIYIRNLEEDGGGGLKGRRHETEDDIEHAPAQLLTGVTSRAINYTI